MEKIERNNNEIEIDDVSSITFPITEKILDNIDTDDSVDAESSIELKKTPKELFFMFISYLKDSPGKIDSIKGKNQEAILNFISDKANKDIVLTEYVSYIKRFDLDAEGSKLDKKDKEIFTMIKDKIEEVYN